MRLATGMVLAHGCKHARDYAPLLLLLRGCCICLHKAQAMGSGRMALAVLLLQLLRGGAWAC